MCRCRSPRPFLLVLPLGMGMVMDTGTGTHIRGRPLEDSCTTTPRRRFPPPRTDARAGSSATGKTVPVVNGARFGAGDRP
ncbi:hypothetical protein GALMADRAFT_229052 [Galerina marginata CBS 339.88]|uniref:Secreted protein n=1 Tax=Galerina marginata (strain CBS 339.88) TaxID=685588 RepID=A0A067SQ88_GALM3|nr:hypothetical protein GALMADRAFT_229052 [Galerina marginata CBS 339.88]